mmetsp:Transcript_17668/g.26761  ORF Transcript_17668/g.26761 Transcript_17668/m.26761 type:complete len:88 (+) Transcript_17668:333-596(+)
MSHNAGHLTLQIPLHKVHHMAQVHMIQFIISILPLTTGMTTSRKVKSKRMARERFGELGTYVGDEPLISPADHPMTEDYDWFGSIQV